MIGKRPDRPPMDAYEAAAWWSARRRLGLLSTREEVAFADWLTLPVNGIAWEATEGPMIEVGEFATVPEIQALRAGALAVQPRRSPTVWRFAAIGSAVMAPLAASLIWMAAPAGNPFREAAPQMAAETSRHYETHVGERRDILLTDGSRIALNTASVLDVNYTPGRRDIHLIEGQALFHVAKNPDRPFVVAAGDRLITATGTAFDVRVGDKGAVTVVLVEGHVTVAPVKREGLARLFPVLAREALDPGEKLSVAADVPMTIATADIERDTSWSRGQIVFRDDRLVDAIEEMNRYSTSRLVIDDDRLGQLRISGVFGSDHVDDFIAALTAFYPIEATHPSPNVVMLRWRGNGKS